MIANYTLLTLIKELDTKFAMLQNDFEKFKRQHTDELEAATRWNQEQAVAAANAAVYARTWQAKIRMIWRRLRAWLSRRKL